jgi:dihydropteroate synthase
MGVLNVTPDSFSDGGRYSDPDAAYARALEMEEAGADLIDLGAESTRPGSHRISAEEEWRRLIPVLKRLKDQLRIPISLDTYKAEIAERAFEYGVEIINDPSGLTFEPGLAKAVAQANAGFVVNHMRGTPETWGRLGPLPDVMGTVARDLEATAHRAQRAGIDRARIVLDPGLGFGKRKEQNSELLARLGELVRLEYPVLVGPSRKSFIARGNEAETEFATAAAVAASILNGASIVRVHDVKAMHAAVRVADEIVRARETAKRETEGMARVKRVDWTHEGPKPVKPTLKRAAPAAEPPAPPVAEPPKPERRPEPRPLPPGRGSERKPMREGRTFDRPRRQFSDRPRRDDGSPRDDRPRREGPPRESRGGFRREGPPREGGPVFRREGPPRESRGPRRDGPPREGRGGFRREGPPRENRGGFRRDGPPRGPRKPRPGGDKGGRPPFRRG